MGKGQLILLYSGEEDEIFIGNPQTTFFKNVFIRHTNFSYEHIIHNLKGGVKFGETITFDITHVGDLIQNMYLHIVLPSIEDDTINYNYTESVGHAIIDNIRLLIGEQIYDQYNGEYLELYSELNNDYGKQLSLDKLINKVGYYSNSIVNRKQQDLWIPLAFWFCKDTYSSLPISALSNSSIKIEVKLRKFTDIVSGNNILSCNNYDNKKITKCELLGKHYFLDTQERTTFLSKPLEYCITQTNMYLNQNIQNNLQTDATANNIIPSNYNIDIPFKCLLKELFWTINTDINIEQNNYFKYTNSNQINHFYKGRLQLNGDDIMDTMDNTYFSKILPYEFYKMIPINRNFAVYPFSCKPFDNHPTGHLNLFLTKSFNIQLETVQTISNQYVNIYGTSYNVIRIENGISKMYYVYV